MLNIFGKEKKHQEITVNVSNRTIIRVIIFMILAIALVTFLRSTAHAFVLIFIAFFLAIALNAPVHWLARHLPSKNKNSRTVATTVSFAIMVLLLGGFVASIAPPLTRQTGSFISAAPGLIENVQSQDSSLGKFVRNYHLEGQVNKFSGQLSDRLDSLTTSLVGTFTRITSSIFAILTVLVFTFMMLIEGPRWVDIGQRLVPEDYRNHVTKLVREMNKVVRGFVNGQVILATFAALFIFVPLVILNVSYPIALMVIVFICGLIPLVGHTIGAIIVTTIALFHSVPAAIIILAYYITYQQIENYLLQPKIQSNTTNMSPLLVFAAVIIGVNFDGLLGGLLAIPIAGCIRIVVLDYVGRRNLLEPAKREIEATD